MRICSSFFYLIPIFLFSNATFASSIAMLERIAKTTSKRVTHADFAPIGTNTLEKNLNTRLPAWVAKGNFQVRGRLDICNNILSQVEQVLGNIDRSRASFGYASACHEDLSSDFLTIQYSQYLEPLTESDISYVTEIVTKRQSTKVYEHIFNFKSVWAFLVHIRHESLQDGKSLVALSRDALYSNIGGLYKHFDFLKQAVDSKEMHQYLSWLNNEFGGFDKERMEGALQNASVLTIDAQPIIALTEEREMVFLGFGPSIVKNCSKSCL